MRSLAFFLLAATLSAQTPDNSGRQALTNQLDAIAAQQTAARREVIAQIHTKQQAIARQHEVRARLIALLGGPWPERSPLNPTITGTSEHEGIRIERILFYSQPNFLVTALLYLPDSTTKLPAILMAPGHSPAGKAGDAAFALAFAHRGFAVLSYDPIGQGERLQYPDPSNPNKTLLKGPTGEHGEAGLQPTLIGDAVARYFLIDAIRATDYLLTRPEIDPTRIGAFGCSGGGQTTALTAFLDPRISVAGVACFTTSYDTLLPSIGPQDSEQSTPDFIASGLDFPDWSELFAPKPYAIIATTEDMFPFAGAQSTEKESRAFYAIFNAQNNLAFITGPGHHGNLRPILPQILDFFTTHLHPTSTNTVISTEAQRSGETPVLPASAPQKPNGPPPPVLPPADTQVTPTGQVSTSYPNTETVYTLNLKRSEQKLSADHAQTLAQLQQSVRDVTHATASPGTTRINARLSPLIESEKHGVGPGYPEQKIQLVMPDGLSLAGRILPTEEEGRQVAVLVLTDMEDPFAEEGARQLSEGGGTVLMFSPRPFPTGTEETKSPVLGPFYLTELRAELTGHTLMGLRIDDVIHAIDYLTSRPDARNDQVKLFVEATTPEMQKHLELIALHVAVLDSRVKLLFISPPTTYTEYLHQPIPHDAPQDILPGVLLHYDTPDLIRALGPRVTVSQ